MDGKAGMRASIRAINANFPITSSFPRINPWVRKYYIMQSFRLAIRRNISVAGVLNVSPHSLHLLWLVLLLAFAIASVFACFKKAPSNTPQHGNVIDCICS